MVEETNDAELIERARNLHLWSPPHVQKREQCRMLKTLADRLAELTTPEPWRSPSEPPSHFGMVWVRFETPDGPKVLCDHYDRGAGCWMTHDGSVTGWKPIVRPLP